MTIIKKYKNGNYWVTLKSDGTKIRKTSDDSFNPEFPESIDLKITDFCENDCGFCHEKSSLEGKHASLNNILTTISNLPSGVEIAIGGGNVLAYPDLERVLRYMIVKGLVPNLTVNVNSLLNKEYLKRLSNLKSLKYYYGLGISGINSKLGCALKLPFCNIIDDNVVMHCIAGIQSPMDILKCNGFNKFLILGYKQVGRGKKYYSDTVKKNIDYWKFVLPTIVRNKHVAFDNLALEQLDVKSLVSKEIWAKNFMGDDGKFTMFIDAVKRHYAISSCHERKKWFEGFSAIKAFKSI